MSKKTIRDKHPNSKFCKGSKNWERRQKQLAEIMARIGAGQSFADLQGPLPDK